MWKVSQKIYKLIDNLRSDLPSLKVLYDEPLSAHTSFKIGGPADLMLIPRSRAELKLCLEVLERHGIEPFFLGGGTNLLVSDRGVRGVVVQLAALSEIRCEGEQLVCQAGAEVNSVCEVAAEHGLTGVEFLSGMPGTIGGAVWMNARCYGGSVADVLQSVIVYEPGRGEECIVCEEEMFSYKSSPFQSMDGCILEIKLGLAPGDREQITAVMEKNYRDRVEKGHFRAPSAGSLFKNSRDFGAPTGQILEQLGLKGTVCGGAAIAPYHANIFINQDNASAKDVASLIVRATELAWQRLNIRLEPEVRFVGEWDDEILAALNLD